MSLKNYIRKRIYRWHRTTSVIVALPILLWTTSGFLHPVMSYFKPAVRNMSLPTALIDTARVTVPLEQALTENGITAIHNVRIIKLYEIFYYQVEQNGMDTLVYINCQNGNRLLNGDRQYATYLAKRYLWEEVKGAPAGHANHHSQPVQAGIIGAIPALTTTPAALPKAPVKSVELITAFNSEYKASNKLLPVYKVSFDRSDSIRLYIVPSSGKLAAAMDTKRAHYTRFFSAAHSWSFLDGIGKWKYALLGTVSLLCLFTALSGFYVQRMTSNKRKLLKTAPGQLLHRRLGNVFLVTTLLFAISGSFHTLYKLGGEQPSPKNTETIAFQAKDLTTSLPSLLNHLDKGEKLENLSLVTMKGETWWQLCTQKDKERFTKYIQNTTGSLLRDGDLKYGQYLACRYKGVDQGAVAYSKVLSSFSNGHGMAGKSMPVVETRFKDGEWYDIETATGALAAKNTPISVMERFSFSNLHMHHYWESWLDKESGQTAKNSVLIGSTLGLMLLAASGMLMYLSKKRRAKPGAP